MRIDTNTNSVLPQLQKTNEAKKDKYGISRTGDTSESTESTEFNLSSCTSRSLSEEEQRRLEELKDQLVDLLKDPENITPEKERQIRQIEKEMEKLTGIKMPKRKLSSLAKMMSSMDDKEKEKTEAGLPGLENKALQEERLRSMNMPSASLEPGKGIMDYAINAYTGSSLASVLQGSAGSINTKA